jgi:hypothetical protein
MSKNETILEILKDDQEYYKGVGKLYLSNSDIGVLLSNPQDYGKVREDDKALAEGRLFHQLLLEPDKAKNVHQVDVSTRTTKAYKEYIDEHKLPFCLLTKEVDDITYLTKRMSGNIQFYEDIYRDGNQYEVPMVGVIKGHNWKGKADILCSDMIIDLKTTSDINGFKWSAKKYNYDSQCYIYQMLFGRPLVFYVIDKVSGQLGIFRPSDNFVKNGEAKVERALEVWDKYFGSNPTEDIDNHYINEILE